MRSPSDVLIVGNGALGLFVAERLARRGQANVTLIGPPDRPGGASIAAGAMLGSFGEVTKDTFATEHGRAKFEIGLAAHDEWPAVLESLSDLASGEGDALHHVADTHIVLNGCGGTLDSQNFKAIISAMNEYGVPWQEVDGDDIPGYHPRPDGRALRGLHIPGEGAIDGNQVLRLMERRCELAGVKILSSTGTTLLSSGDRVIGARRDGGQDLFADVVIVAAGARTHDLLLTVLGSGDVQPMLSGAGLAVVVERGVGSPFETVVRTPNRGGACGLHLVPLREDREYIGASNVLFGRPQIRPSVAASIAILDQIGHQLDENASAHTFIEWRAGNRPVTLDGFPLIGWGSLEGLYVLTGTYRDGFHSAPSLAEHVASEIFDGEPMLDWPFSPCRRPLTNWTIEESIEEYALHMMALWFETGGHLPSQTPTAFLADHYRAEARQLYEVTGIEVGLGADVVCYLTTLRRPAELAGIMRYLRSNDLMALTDRRSQKAHPATVGAR